MSLHFNPQSVAAIAELCLGMPNRALSTKDELRFGNNGSVSVALLKATYFDHEASAGGGMLDLISKKRGLSGRDAIEWLRKEGINIAGNESSNETEQKSRAFFVEAFDYKDENGALLFQVVRQEFRLPCGKVELSDNGKPKKTFKQRRPDPDHPGKWIWRTQGFGRSSIACRN
jgi:hypothetical protein